MANLLTFVLRSTYFWYNGSIYKQKDCATMGSPVSAVIANLHMESFEEQAITTSSYEPRIWKRYVDDTFTILDRENVDDFLQHLNNQQPSIRFTMETEKDNKLAFLDTEVLREPDGRLTTSVYRKPTHTDQYLAYDSHHPQSVKRGIVKCLYERAKRLVTKPSVISEEKKICHLFWFLIVILFLSCGNLYWLLDNLNISQKKTLCVHMNHVLNVEAFVARSLPGGHSKPTSLFFALNVGMDSSGSVFIASGSQSCCHWTVCHVDREKKKIVYDDSLAWSVPVDHLPTLKQFIEHIYGECLFDYEQPIYMIR